MILSLALAIPGEAVDAAPLLADLSPAERTRYAARHRDKRRREYLLSRWLVRQHLAAELGAHPSDLEIAYPPGRAPRCADTPRYIGISHSGPASLSLIATRPGAGCDIETIRERRFTPQRLADAHFDPAEARALRAAPPDERLAVFHRLWTLKEAYLKACGLGLAAGLARPAFAVSPDLRRLHTPPADGPWFFGALELALPAGQIALAVAAQGSEETIELTRFYPAAPGKQRTPLGYVWQTSAIDPSRG